MATHKTLGKLTVRFSSIEKRMLAQEALLLLVRAKILPKSFQVVYRSGDVTELELTDDPYRKGW